MSIGDWPWFGKSQYLDPFYVPTRRRCPYDEQPSPVQDLDALFRSVTKMAAAAVPIWVAEEGGGYRLDIEAPGRSATDFYVAVVGGGLKVRADPIVAGSRSRPAVDWEIGLPDDVSATASISATYSAGVLIVTVPKGTDTPVRVIHVDAV